MAKSPPIENTFTCPTCEQVYKVWQPKHRLRYPDCGLCGEGMNLVREVSKAMSRPTRCYDEPIIMYSVGLHPDEFTAFKTANREIDLTPDGVPIARTRAEKKQVLDYFRYEEHN